MLHLILAFFVSSPAIAAEIPSKNAELQLLSRKYQQEMYPKGNIDAPWVITKAPKRYPYMHAMVVGAFYAKQADHREAAMKWLKEYKCENALACSDFASFYDGALKANVLTMKGEARGGAEVLGTEIRKRTETLLTKKPPTTGLCGPDSERASWVALAYELYCPAGAKPKERVDLESVKAKVEIASNQLIMSSSFLEALEHDGASDCASPWKVRLRCGGGMASSYSLRCERSGKGTRVVCVAKK